MKLSKQEWYWLITAYMRDVIKWLMQHFSKGDKMEINIRCGKCGYENMALPEGQCIKCGEYLYQFYIRSAKKINNIVVDVIFKLGLLIAFALFFVLFYSTVDNQRYRYIEQSINNFHPLVFDSKTGYIYGMNDKGVLIKYSPIEKSK